MDQPKVDSDMGEMITEYADIGKYKGNPVKIRVADNVTSVIQPARRIPIHYMKPLKDDLGKMIEQDVIKGPLEEEEGSWISNQVITDKRWNNSAKKEGQRIQIRANLDGQPLNNYVYQTHEPMPTPDELRHKLQGSNCFSTFDMIHSFHQFILEDLAMKLFTFGSPWGYSGTGDCDGKFTSFLRVQQEGQEGAAGL